jgi:hypothetical protein
MGQGLLLRTYEGIAELSTVFTAHAVSVDGCITGRNPGGGRGLGDGTMLFDWYFGGDTPSQVFGARATPRTRARRGVIEPERQAVGIG